MNIIKKLPLVKISALTLLVTIIISGASFGTNSWFLQTQTNGLDETGTMGTVSVSLAADGKTITNDSNIDIILRVHVIAEWVPVTADTVGVPTDITLDNIIVDETNWTKYENEDGIFLAYTGDAPTIAEYAKIKANGKTPIIVPSVSVRSNLESWEPQITLIAEALQATEKAYGYTKGADGVPSWQGGDK